MELPIRISHHLKFHFQLLLGAIALAKLVLTDLKTNAISECCAMYREPDHLYGCILEYSKMCNRYLETTVKHHEVTLVTYVTADIATYAAFSLAVNLEYAAKHNYSFDIMTPADIPAEDIEPDARWMKIKLLRDAIQAHIVNSQANNTEPLAVTVWMDADLMVLDLNFTIESIALSHPNAHVIMSKDIPAAAVSSNSGMIIVRNTHEALAILNQWWVSYDRSKCCDQHAFTWLYESYDDAQRSRIALLPTSAINSHFPAWLHQDTNDPILHLAGMTSLYRRRVFEYGYQQICAHAAGEYLPPQLGLHRGQLVSFVRELNSQRVAALSAIASRLKSYCSQHDPDPRDGSSNSGINSSGLMTLKEYFDYKSQIDDILKFDDDEPQPTTTLEKNTWQDLKEISVLVRSLLHELLSISTRELLSSADGGAPVPSDLELAERTSQVVISGFDLVMELRKAAKPANEERSVLLGFQDILFGSLPKSRSPTKRVVYYQFKFCSFMAATYKDLSTMHCTDDDINRDVSDNKIVIANMTTSSDAACDLAHRIQWLTKAVDIWSHLATLNYFGTDYVMADPYKEGSERFSELGVLRCMAGQYSIGLQALQASLRLQEETMEGYRSIKIATVGMIRQAEFSYGNTLVNAGMCAQEASAKAGQGDAENRAAASVWLSRAKEIFERLGCYEVTVQHTDNQCQDYGKAIAAINEHFRPPPAKQIKHPGSANERTKRIIFKKRKHVEPGIKLTTTGEL